MSVCLWLFIGYVIGRLDAKYGHTVVFWMGTWCRWPIIQARKVYNRFTVKPYPIGFETGYFGRVVKDRHFCWDYGNWFYPTNGETNLSHGLIKWYEDIT